jgi:hypothetical protein
MIPAVDLNRCPVRILPPTEVDALTAARWDRWQEILAGGTDTAPDPDETA